MAMTRSSFEEEEQTTIIKIGDVVNLTDLLFTESRDYLIKYKDNQLVKDKELAGKVIILYFQSLGNGPNDGYINTTDLVDIYNKLEPKGGLEVVFVAVMDGIPCRHPGESNSNYSSPHEIFESFFSTMPWTAIPFSDLKSRKRLERKFGMSSNIDSYEWPISFVLDPRGVVLQSHADYLFSRYGPAGYPFSKERLECLVYEDNAAKTQLSLKNLLASHERDYVISNEGDLVPVHKLEDKVVGLFFYTDILNEHLTLKLKMAYEELSKNMVDFEVVLIYLHPISLDTWGDAFWKAFEAMPWLAIPFKDTSCIKKLYRIFEEPLCMWEPDPFSTLVIIGPRGKFIEPFGAHILMRYGTRAYPFTRSSAVNLRVKNVKDVKPEMFWDLDAVFRQQNGSEVRFSQIVGKRILVIFFNMPEATLSELSALYIRMKGTNDEFEVIHIVNEESKRWAAAIPWLMHPPLDMSSEAWQVIDRVFFGSSYGIIAFDRDGRVVRTAPLHDLMKMGNSFYGADDMKDEFLLEVIDDFHDPFNYLKPYW